MQETDPVSIAKERPGGIFPVLITLVIVFAIVAVGAIMLPKDPSSSATRASPVKAGIPNIAVITGFIPTFGQALTASGLAEILKGAGPFTVFAPAESAFASLPAGTLDNLLKPENKAALRAIIGNHIVPGKFMAADLKGTTSLKTLDGAVLEVRADSDGITVNGAQVTTPDMRASNGVVHIVSAVLLPPG